jgi:hypothetical protein
VHTVFLTPITHQTIKSSARPSFDHDGLSVTRAHPTSHFSIHNLIIIEIPTAGYSKDDAIRHSLSVQRGTIIMLVATPPRFGLILGIFLGGLSRTYIPECFTKIV